MDSDNFVSYIKWGQFSHRPHVTIYTALKAQILVDLDIYTPIYIYLYSQAVAIEFETNFIISKLARHVQPDVVKIDKLKASA